MSINVELPDYIWPQIRELHSQGWKFAIDQTSDAPGRAPYPDYPDRESGPIIGTATRSSDVVRATGPTGEDVAKSLIEQARRFTK